MAKWAHCSACIGVGLWHVHPTKDGRQDRPSSEKRGSSSAELERRIAVLEAKMRVSEGG